MDSYFSFKDRKLPLGRSHIMGILNVTPDSFSDGGQFIDSNQALKQAEKMCKDGAAILDIGGESTRPGAAPISIAEEMDRVLPIVEAVSDRLDVIVSVDSSSPELMLEAGRLGAHLINDVRALSKPGALVAAHESGMSVCLMHMQGRPESMQDQPTYECVQEEVEAFMRDRIEACLDAGIHKNQILVDPGFGFGKTADHNLSLLNRLDTFLKSEYPILVGLSRKSMLGIILDRQVDERLAGTLATTAAAVMKGAFIIRVHDVAENVDVVKTIESMLHETVI